MFEIILFLKSQNNIISIEFLIEILFGIGAEIISDLETKSLLRFFVLDWGRGLAPRFLWNGFSLILNQ